jgi:hypothetical protein
MKSNIYEALKDGDRYTIGVYDEGYKAYIVNDGICNYYWWDTEVEAQEAADALNSYEGCHGLGEHGYGNDKITQSEAEEAGETELVILYRLFNAIVCEED